MVKETTTEYRDATDDDFKTDLPSGFSSSFFKEGSSGLAHKESKLLSGDAGGNYFSSSPKLDESLGQTDEDFEMEALEKHNECRKKHGVPALQLDKKVSRNHQSFKSSNG